MSCCTPNNRSARKDRSLAWRRDSQLATVAARAHLHGLFSALMAKALRYAFPSLNRSVRYNPNTLPRSQVRLGGPAADNDQ